MRHTDQIIESDRRRDGSRWKAENRGGQAGHLFECPTVEPSHPRQRATIRRQDPLRVKHFTLLSGRGPRTNGKAADATVLLRQTTPEEAKMNTIDIAAHRVARLVDELFGTARYGEICKNPVTGADYVHGIDPVAPQKETARRALFAREWFAIHGPADAQPLPLWCNESKAPERGFVILRYIVRLYERSLSDRNYDLKEHPPFAAYVSGVLWEAERVDGIIGTIPTDDPVELENLKKRFPPRELAGMGPGFCWLPPKQYAETMPGYRRSMARQAERDKWVKTQRIDLRPIDESVKIPEAVRRAAARANSLYPESKAQTHPKN
jgi:hypothetical protein